MAENPDTKGTEMLLDEEGNCSSCRRRRRSGTPSREHPICTKHAGCTQSRFWEPYDCEYCKAWIREMLQADFAQRKRIFGKLRRALQAYQRTSENSWSYNTNFYKEVKKITITEGWTEEYDVAIREWLTQWGGL